MFLECWITFNSLNNPHWSLGLESPSPIALWKSHLLAEPNHTIHEDLAITSTEIKPTSNPPVPQTNHPSIVWTLLLHRTHTLVWCIHLCVSQRMTRLWTSLVKDQHLEDLSLQQLSQKPAYLYGGCLGKWLRNWMPCFLAIKWPPLEGTDSSIRLEVLKLFP
jgi:hypothetical protein